MITMAVQLSVDDHERADELTRWLTREMRELDIEDARLGAPSRMPAGAKGDLVTVGAIIATMAGSKVLVSSVCELIRTCVTRGDGRSIDIHIGPDTLKLTGGNKAQHRQLIDAFIAQAVPNSDSKSDDGG